MHPGHRLCEPSSKPNTEQQISVTHWAGSVAPATSIRWYSRTGPSMLMSWVVTQEPSWPQPIRDTSLHPNLTDPNRIRSWN